MGCTIQNEDENGMALRWVQGCSYLSGLLAASSVLHKIRKIMISTRGKEVVDFRGGRGAEGLAVA